MLRFASPNHSKIQLPGPIRLKFPFTWPLRTTFARLPLRLPFMNSSQSRPTVASTVLPIHLLASVWCVLAGLGAYARTVADTAIMFKPAPANFDGALFSIRVNDLELEGVFLGDRQMKRPLILFIPGSGPLPLFTSFGDTAYYPLFPHQLLDNGTAFNFIFLSKPGIPALCKKEQLSDNYYFLDTVTGMPPSEYLHLNTLEFCRSAYSTLLDHIGEVCASTMVIAMGHSQGARVVAELATHSKIDKLVYMSADPLGRMAALYDGEYAKFRHRDPEKLSFLHDLLNPAFADSTYMGERYESFRSFAKPSLIPLSKATAPTLLVYGDMDPSCPNCYVLSLLPEWLPQMKALRYPGYDHNYFDPEGTNHWGEVVADVFRWILGN